MLCLSTDDRRIRSAFLLLVLYTLYINCADFLFKEVNSVYYLTETLFFVFWSTWIMFRPEFKTAKTINKDNILLAFYRGGGGSFLMNFFELLGLPVKSVCVVAGEHCLRLKKSKEYFQLTKTGQAIHGNDKYVVIDTGVAYDKKFVESMEECANIKATKSGMRIRCIEAIRHLLAQIGPEWKPVNFLETIPSLYLRKAIKL